jgi:hypothetical protein
MRGSPASSARMPSAASAWSMGSVRGAHIESTQCASAFSPEATLSPTGRETISDASYTIVRGSTRASTPVVLVDSSVSPQTSVASDPAYVVGTAMIGRPVVSATALARPVVEPPPTLTSTSTSWAPAASRARSATGTGTCMTTSSWTSATGRPSVIRAARSASAGAAMTIARRQPPSATSAASASAACPDPKRTRCPRVSCWKDRLTGPAPGAVPGTARPRGRAAG